MTGTNRGFLKTRFKGLSKATGEYECAFEVRMCPFVKLRAELATQRAGGESFVFLFFFVFPRQMAACWPLHPLPPARGGLGHQKQGTGRGMLAAPPESTL